MNSNGDALAVAGDLWRFAELAYEPKSTVERELGRSVDWFYAGIGGMGDDAYIANYGAYAVLAFAGSNDGLDWLLNGVALKDRSGVHIGFDVLLKEYAYDVVMALQKLQVGTVFVVGHSLGGAKAQLMARKYLGGFAGEVVCVAYGAPRVASAKFFKARREQVGVRTIRVDYGDDVVPHLPPARWGFRHDGELVRVGPRLKWWQKARLVYRAYKARKGGDLPWWEHHRFGYSREFGH